MFYDLDWERAEQEYKRAIELNPNASITYEVYSYLLSGKGQLDEGIQMAQRALDREPLSATYSGDLGLAYYLARRYDEAVKQYQKAIEIDPAYPSTYQGIGIVYEKKGMYEEAIASYQKAIGLTGRAPTFLALLGHAYASSGRKSEALKILDELKRASASNYVSPYDMAILYTGLGEKELALENLKRAYEERAGWIILLKVEPLFDPLRTDVRFVDLLRRLDLPQ